MPSLDVFVLGMRWYRDANSPDKQAFNNGGILGTERAEWLKRELSRSTATWKVISDDMPLAEVVTDDGGAFESVSQGDDGKPLGRELRIAEILTFIKRNHINNVVWLTTDVHYTAAHYFDPNKAAYSDVDPFWQFTTGPERRCLPARCGRHDVRRAAGLRQGAVGTEHVARHGVPVLRPGLDLRRPAGDDGEPSRQFRRDPVEQGPRARSLTHRRPSPRLAGRAGSVGGGFVPTLGACRAR